MESYIVKLTETAKNDMDEIYYYIADRLLSPENAIGQYNRIADSILSLSQFPERYPLFDCEPEHSRGIHKMVVNNYVVSYVIDNQKKEITVIAVMYGASDIHIKLLSRY